MIESPFKKMLFGAICGLAGVLGYSTMNMVVLYLEGSKNSRTPIQTGYVNPRDVKIDWEDKDKSDGKGLPETYIDIGTNSYAFHYDTNGRPTLTPYRVIPQKTEPQRIVLEDSENR